MGSYAITEVEIGHEFLGVGVYQARFSLGPLVFGAYGLGLRYIFIEFRDQVGDRDGEGAVQRVPEDADLDLSQSGPDQHRLGRGEEGL